MTALRGHKAEGDRGWSRRAAPEGAIWAEVWTQSGSEACWEELHQAEVWTQSGREACWEELHQAEAPAGETPQATWYIGAGLGLRRWLIHCVTFKGMASNSVIGEKEYFIAMF